MRILGFEGLGRVTSESSRALALTGGMDWAEEIEAAIRKSERTRKNFMKETIVMGFGCAKLDDRSAGKDAEVRAADDWLPGPLHGAARGAKKGRGSRRKGRAALVGMTEGRA